MANIEGQEAARRLESEGYRLWDVHSRDVACDVLFQMGVGGGTAEGMSEVQGGNIATATLVGEEVPVRFGECARVWLATSAVGDGRVMVWERVEPR